jgi:hypothetical protein
VNASDATTPLAAKIGVKEGMHVVLVHAPSNWSPGALPAKVRLSRRVPTTQVDVVIAFFSTAAALRCEVEGLSLCIVTKGSLWLAWPRRAGGHDSDITDNVVRDITLPLGLVDVKVAALDDNWSGLKFVWRKERHAEHP